MVEETRTRPVLETASAVWSRRKWLAVLAFAAPMAAGVPQANGALMPEMQLNDQQLDQITAYLTSLR